MAWQNKRYGTVDDPVHKSHLNELTGEYGCPRRFKYQRDLEAEVAANPNAAERKPSVNGHLACGTAAHETIARALNNPRVRDHLLRVPGATMEELSTKDQLESRVRATFSHELRVAADGRDIDWGDETPEKMISSRVDMIVGTLGTLCKYVRKVLAVEPGFVVELDGVYYSGHIDLIFEPADTEPGTVGLADWKSSKQKPDPIELAHGWEGGIYSAACEHGTFLPRECVRVERSGDEWCGSVPLCTVTGDVVDALVTAPSRWQAERDALERALMRVAQGDCSDKQYTLGKYPTRVYHVHMRDFVPYEKAGSKEAKRPEDLVYYGLEHPATVKYIKGHMRGPGWLPVELRANDVARLAYRARNVVGTVRMGRFFDLVREHCRRCPFKSDCLTGGYAPRGDDLVQLKTEMKKAGLI